MRLRKAVLHLVAGLAAIGIGACGSMPSINIESKKVDYKSAGKMAPLEVPPDLTRPTSDDRFVVPDINNPKSTATYSEYNRDRASSLLRWYRGKPAIFLRR